MTPIKLAAGALVSLLLFTIFLMSYFTVAPYERYVVTSFGKIDYVAEPGLHFKMPFAQSTHDFRTDIQEVSPSKGVNTYTIDNQEVDVVFNVFYRIPPDQVAFIYTNMPDVRDRLYTMSLDRLKGAMGKVNVSSVAEKRGELRTSIKNTLTTDAKSLGVEITDVQLTDLQYTESYRVAISAAATAKAGVEAVEYKKQQAQKQAEQDAIVAEGTANAVRAKAKGDADATVFAAEASSRATVLNGQAEAAAIEAKTKALAQNAQLVEYTKALQWDGKLPVNMYAGAPVPFLNLSQPK